MPHHADTRRIPGNNIGLLRLLLAAAVIVGHSPEFIDGNRSREPLTMLFGTVSLGELAVDGFFLLSGFLITGSILSPGMTLGRFMQRRVWRIVPGYVVAYVLSAFLLGSIVGVDILGSLPATLLNFAFLAQPPDSPAIFADAHLQSLNGSMWTIAYEFRCYVLVGLMGAAGLLAHRRVVAGLTVAVLLASVAVHHPSLAWRLRHVQLHELHLALGSLEEGTRLSGAFLVGCCVRLFERELSLIAGRKLLVAVASVLLVEAMFFGAVAQAAVAVLGWVPLFWLAFHARLGRLAHVNAGADISYGVYLYGWPLGLLLVWSHPTISPLLLATLTLALAILAGIASWYGVERWFKPTRREQGRPPGRAGDSRPELSLA